MVPKKNSVEKKWGINMPSQWEIKHPSAVIVHEIRNPLTAVKGFLQLIKPYLKEIGKEQYAVVALMELDRAHQMIFDYLHGTQIQSDSSNDLPLKKVIEELTLLYEGEVILKNIIFTTNLSNNDAVLKIPANRLKQVLINIINNAIEAIDKCSETTKQINITTEVNAVTAVIKITDSCGGLTKEIMDKLFIPHHSSKETGTGIGLWICKNIIEDYQGTIHVDSIKGKQTTFTICFPL